MKFGMRSRVMGVLALELEASDLFLQDKREKYGIMYI
jgi:hypothetical protein